MKKIVILLILILVSVYIFYINNLIPKQYINEIRSIARVLVHELQIFKQGEGKYV